MLARTSWKQRMFFVSLSTFIILLGASAYVSILSNPSSPWFEQLIKPSLYPGKEIFFPVWTTLYALIAIAYAFVDARARKHEDGRTALNLFISNLILNIAWTPAFFGLQQPELAYTIIILIWGTLALLMIKVERFSRIAVLLLVPYLAWVTFATWLNYSFIVLN